MWLPGSKNASKMGEFVMGKWGLFSEPLPSGSLVPPGYHFGLILVPFLRDFLYFSLPCSPLLACLRKRQARQILCQKLSDSCLPPRHASQKIGESCLPHQGTPIPKLAVAALPLLQLRFHKTVPGPWTNDKPSGTDLSLCQKIGESCLPLGKNLSPN